MAVPYQDLESKETPPWFDPDAATKLNGWLNNIGENAVIVRYGRDLMDIPRRKDVPAIILGEVDDLTLYTIQRMREERFKGILTISPQSLIPCLEWGVLPDFTCITESIPVDVLDDPLFKANAEKLTAHFVASANPYTLKRWLGPKYFSTRLIHEKQFPNVAHAMQLVVRKTVQNVGNSDATLAWTLAYHIECSPILLVGVRSGKCVDQPFEYLLRKSKIQAVITYDASNLLPPDIPKIKVDEFLEICRRREKHYLHNMRTQMFRFLTVEDLTYTIPRPGSYINIAMRKNSGKTPFKHLNSGKKILVIGAAESARESRELIMNFDGTVLCTDRFYGEQPWVRPFVHYVLALEYFEEMASYFDRLDLSNVSAIFTAMVDPRLTELKWKEALFLYPVVPTADVKLWMEKLNPNYPWIDTTGHCGGMGIALATEYSDAEEVHMTGLQLDGKYQRYLPGTLEYMRLHDNVKYINHTKRGFVHAPFIEEAE